MGRFLESLLVLLGAWSLSEGFECQPLSGCECRSDEFLLNISSLLRYPFAGISNPFLSGTTITFAPCGTAIQCGNSNVAAVCLLFQSSQSNCGSRTSSIWNVTSLKPLSFSIQYNDGDPISTTNKKRYSLVMFTSDESVDVSIALSSYGSINDPKYVFKVSGKDVQNTLSKRSAFPGVIGFVLIMVALVLILTYCIGGGLYQYCHKGARGVEIIPNVLVWIDLVYLIKDGLLFLFSPCCGHSYEKLKGTSR